MRIELKPTVAALLDAVARGKRRKGSGRLLRKLIARRELQSHGVLACYCCGRPVERSESTIEHITPVSLGGKTVLENLALSHPGCNERRGNSPTPRAAIVRASGGA